MLAQLSDRVDIMDKATVDRLGTLCINVIDCGYRSIAYYKCWGVCVHACMCVSPRGLLKLSTGISYLYCIFYGQYHGHIMDISLLLYFSLLHLEYAYDGIIEGF